MQWNIKFPQRGLQFQCTSIAIEHIKYKDSEAETGAETDHTENKTPPSKHITERRYSSIKATQHRNEQQTTTKTTKETRQHQSWRK